MLARWFGVFAILGLASLFSTMERLDACCAVSRLESPVVNADQSVIIIWDAKNKIQHFIRRASFAGASDDFGFLVPSPTQPELSESGDAAFPYFQDLTKPEVKYRPRPLSFGCSATIQTPPALGQGSWSVNVLEQKTVAGFDAAVLEAGSAKALVQWLKGHGYAYSPEVEAWAKPYVEQGWKITALKVARDKGSLNKTVLAAALRMSFKTDRPLFPYREPDYKGVNEKLGAKSRVLRIYFVGEARYRGELTKDQAWSGQAVWSGRLDANQRAKAIDLLKLPQATGPSQWWLTEFEDNWSYKGAPADVYFTRDDKQDSLRRPAIIQFVSGVLPRDISIFVLGAAALAPSLLVRMRRRWR